MWLTLRSKPVQLQKSKNFSMHLELDEHENQLTEYLAEVHHQPDIPRRSFDPPEPPYLLAACGMMALLKVQNISKHKFCKLC